MPESQVTTNPIAPTQTRPSLLTRSLTLMKPVTWFAPAWAFLCGSIASGAPQWSFQDLGRIAVGTLLAGPILCGLSQVVNDYCDRDVDAINEPHRLIPAGLVSTTQVFVTIGVLVVIAFGVALYLGEQVALLTAIGMVLSLVYSVQPIRAKQNGWVGNGVVGLSYEGLPWLAGHLAFGALSLPSIVLALLYSVGAHGIMTINDFKSVEGDRAVGIKTLPVIHGSWGAAWIAVLTMNIAQLFIILMFLVWGRWIAAGVVGTLFVLQLPFQYSFIQDPRGKAVFYNASGILLFVLGMLVSAIGIR